MSISPVGGGAVYQPPEPVGASGGQSAAAPAASKASDADHDGDTDGPGKLDVKA